MWRAGRDRPQATKSMSPYQQPLRHQGPELAGKAEGSCIGPAAESSSTGMPCRISSDEALASVDQPSCNGASCCSALDVLPFGSGSESGGCARSDPAAS